MIRRREFINAHCSVSGQPQHVVVFFEVDEKSDLTKKQSFTCDATSCKHQNSTTCEIFQSAYP